MNTHEAAKTPAGSTNPPVSMRFLRLPDVVQMIGLSRSKIYQMIQNDEFPKPHKIGCKVSVWLLDEVQSWMEQRICLQ
jgi:prophage regulatory protein